MNWAQQKKVAGFIQPDVFIDGQSRTNAMKKRFFKQKNIKKFDHLRTLNKPGVSPFSIQNESGVGTS